MKFYTLVVNRVDDEPELHYGTAIEIREIVKKKQLTGWDYAIVEGQILKGFASKSFDIKNL